MYSRVNSCGVVEIVAMLIKFEVLHMGDKCV